ncbi:MAG: hypothetical protein PVSMB4_01600 [Ktedonobacterales bacterium]
MSSLDPGPLCAAPWCPKHALLCGPRGHYTTNPSTQAAAVMQGSGRLLAGGAWAVTSTPSPARALLARDPHHRRQAPRDILIGRRP